MKIAAIGLVIIALVVALYITDRKVTQAHSLHLADSLDSINSYALKDQIDSVAKATHSNCSLKIYQLNKRIRFQDGVIIRLQDRLDSLIVAQHGR